MILSCQSICKSFGEKVILQDASFHIEEREKAALIGNNGAGKTTLLRIIMQEISADSGNVVIAKDKKIGYLAQYQDIHGHHTIYEELLTTKQYILDMEEKIRTLEQEMKYVAGEKLESLMNSYTRLTHQFELENGYAYKSELTGVLKGLGFTEDEFQKPVSTLSGGQKTRVALGKLLLQKPDLIILDEPTNHLDMSSISWLETYLLNYKGSVLIVSHDRYFLDRIASKIIEIDNTKVTVFSGNYSDYAAKKEQLRQAQRNAYLNQQAEIKHQEEVITKLKSFNREKSIKRAESREKMLAKIEVLDKPTEVRSDMHLQLTPRIESGNDVLTVEHLAKTFDRNTLFSDLSFALKRGEHVAIIGDNGTGKTTILKSIIRQLKPLGGVACLDGSSMEKLTGKELSQKLSVVLTERVRPEMMTCKDVVATGRYPYTGKFGILSEKDWAIVQESMELVHIEELAERDFSKTSDGQKQRVMLARALCQQPDIIVLDEPTSFLDIRYKLEFLSIIQNMSRTRHLSVIMSLHELDLAGRISDKIACVHGLDLAQKISDYVICVHGDRIEKYGTPEEIFTDGYIPKLYGMTVGSYEERTGDLELPKVEGDPKVFVLAGNGTGTAVFRKLQRDGIPFAAGILWENDLDYPAAKALASEVVSVKAFCEMDEASLNRAKALVDQCEEVLCTVDLTEVGAQAESLRILHEYAKMKINIKKVL